MDASWDFSENPKYKESTLNISRFLIHKSGIRNFSEFTLPLSAFTEFKYKPEQTGIHRKILEFSYVEIQLWNFQEPWNYRKQLRICFDSNLYYLIYFHHYGPWNFQSWISTYGISRIFPWIPVCFGLYFNSVKADKGSDLSVSRRFF